MINTNKEEILKFIEENYTGYFISIQLPFALKTYDLSQTEQYFKYILSKFEKHLQGGSNAWIKHPHRFIGFYENGFGQKTWHIHILGSFINPCCDARIGLDEMYAALGKANDKLMKRYNLRQGMEYDIQIANNISKISKYCTKELLYRGFIDSDRITTSEILFDYHKKPPKRKTPARKRQIRINRSCDKQNIKQILSSKYCVIIEKAIRKL